jgi:hypothetical protein
MQSPWLSLDIKVLSLMDHEPTVHPQRTCIPTFPQEGPVWQQSHYGYKRKQKVKEANSF